MRPSCPAAYCPGIRPVHEKEGSVWAPTHRAMSEPPIGAEPMTYTLRACHGVMPTGTKVPSTSWFTSAAVGVQRLLVAVRGSGDVCWAGYPDRRQQIAGGGTNGSAKEVRPRGCHRLADGQ